MKVSIVMPVYNEERTVLEAVAKVLSAPFPENKEVIVVDDGSTDGTAEKLRSLNAPGVLIITFPRNRGKGAAVRAGFAKAAGDIIVVQDADLEYSPDDYPALLKPLFDGKADVVFGSRFLGSGAHRVLLYKHFLANRLLTALSNLFTDLNLSDIEVGSKVFSADVIRQLKLEQDRFGFEPEVTARVARLKCRVFEVPISYYGRTYEEGKKITWKDGFATLWCILKYGIFP